MDRIIIVNSCRDCDHMKALICTKSHKRIPNIDVIPTFCPLKPIWKFYNELVEKNKTAN